MSVDYSAAIMVGLPRTELPDGVQRMLDNEELERFPAYYDAPDSDCLFGFGIMHTDDFSWDVLDPDEFNKVAGLMVKFKLLVGIDPRVYLTTFNTK